MEEQLVTLIAHLVYSGLDVEQALVLGRLYVRGHALQAWAFLPVFPRDLEQVERDAQAKAEEAVSNVVLKAWIEVERLRKADEPPRTCYTREEVARILEPYLLKGF